MDSERCYECLCAGFRWIFRLWKNLRKMRKALKEDWKLYNWTTNQSEGSFIRLWFWWKPAFLRLSCPTLWLKIILLIFLCWSHLGMFGLWSGRNWRWRCRRRSGWLRCLSLSWFLGQVRHYRNDESRRGCRSWQRLHSQFWFSAKCQLAMRLQRVER